MKSMQSVKSDIKSKSIVDTESSPTRKRAKLTIAESRAEKMQPPEDLHQSIAVAAYYLAEARGFKPGSELDDWLTAEAQIDKSNVEM